MYSFHVSEERALQKIGNMVKPVLRTKDKQFIELGKH